MLPVLGGASHHALQAGTPIAQAVAVQYGAGATPLSASAAAPVHPVAAIDARAAVQRDANQKNMLARVYGAHLPMQMHVEQVRETRLL